MQDKVRTPSDRVHLEDIEVGRRHPLRPHQRQQRGHHHLRARLRSPADASRRSRGQGEHRRRPVRLGLPLLRDHDADARRRLARTTTGRRSARPASTSASGSSPCFPTSVLTGRVLHRKRAFAQRPEVGLAKVKFEMLNQAGEVIMIWDSNQLLKVRHPERPAGPASGELRSAAAEARECVGRSPKARRPTRPATSSRTARSARSTNSARTPSPRTRSSTSRASSTRSRSTSTRRRARPRCSEACALPAGIRPRSASGTSSPTARDRAADPRKRHRVARYGPSPGFHNLRWLKPIYPGDTITYPWPDGGQDRPQIATRSRPAAADSQARNQHGDIVFNIRGQILAERREPYKP